MAELGLFSPANPVTYATPLAAYVAAHAQPTAGTCDFPGSRTVVADPRAAIQARGVPDVVLDQLVYGLPPELVGRGLVPAREWQRTHGNPNSKKASGSLFCTHAFFTLNPYVDPDRGAVLARAADGAYYLAVHPCLVGFDVNPWPRVELDGTPICDFYQALRLQDDSLQDLYTEPPNPLGAFGADPFGAARRQAGTSLGSISIGGVNLGDVAKLLGGAGENLDLSGLINVLAALVVQGGNIRGALSDIPSSLGLELGPALLALRDALGDRLPGLGNRLAQALDSAAGVQADTARDSTAASAAAQVAAAPGWFQALVDTAGTVLAKLADVYKLALDTLIGDVLRLFRDDIEAAAPVTAASVDKVAAAALRSALTAGSAAQLAGMGLELLHPLKQMGVQQAIGVLSQFAGFSEIAKPFFSATLRYGLGLPAEHRAAAHFRSVLPPLAEVREAAAAGIVDISKYHDRLVLAGYPDPFPAAFTDLLYTPPPARMLATLLDGSESDRPWLARKFRRLGFSPEDTERATAAAELKTTQPGRSRLVSVLLDQYQHGRLERDDLAAGLTAAGLSATHRAYYLRAADLERRGYRMELVATETLYQLRADLAGPATVRQLLAAIGFSDDEATVRIIAADLRRGVKQVGDEVKTIETEIRQLKAEGLRNATRQLRAGFLQLEQFLAVGQGMGYTRPYLENAAELALLQGPPSSTDAAPAIGLGALEETRRRIAELVAAEVTARRTDRLAAFVSLRTLGLPDDLATTLVGLAEAIAGPTARAGEYGMPAGGVVGGAFGAIEQIVLGGLGELKAPGDVVAELLKRLGLPGRDRSALVRLIRDVRDLFHE